MFQTSRIFIRNTNCPASYFFQDSPTKKHHTYKTHSTTMLTNHPAGLFATLLVPWPHFFLQFSQVKWWSYNRMGTYLANFFGEAVGSRSLACVSGIKLTSLEEQFGCSGMWLCA
jgi:hypothetical protein